MKLPTSFANGRYEVKRFLGEGGKKKVYLAQDTLLGRHGFPALSLNNKLGAFYMSCASLNMSSTTC